MTGFSTWHFPEPKELVKIDATDALQSLSHLVGLVLLPAFLSCHSFCFSAAVSYLYSLLKIDLELDVGLLVDLSLGKKTLLILLLV
jgi:hypothetical protein